MDSPNIGSITNPVNSEDFLPPASCRHRRGDAEFVKSQQADRERMVCGVGLDVHYELNVLSGETGSFQPRLKPFNPRMSGPACPYNYSGKFISESSLTDSCDDPIEMGRKIHATEPYDPALYRKHDPRLVSKTVIIRDYGCKVPITLADTENIARAVLNNYPDRYVDFLREFVSNIMGEAMKKYLVSYRDSLKRILENQSDLNRVSWGAYKNVQGGHCSVRKPGKDETVEQVYCTDSTLPWEDNVSSALQQVLLNRGDTTTGSLTASDVFDIRPCIQQHIATLDDMSSLWCQGFATKERHALAMIWWCNEQGRNLSQDLNLLKSSDHPNYNLIELHVPINPFHENDAPKNPHDLSPDQSCAIRGDLKESSSEGKQTVSYRVPVGQWTGNNETPNVILSSSKGRYAWGWGHPANLTISVTTSTKDSSSESKVIMCAPFLRYKMSTSEWRMKPPEDDDPQGVFELFKYPCSTEYVRPERWGVSLSGEAKNPVEVNVINDAEARNNRKLRQSLSDNDDALSTATLYKGTSPDGIYRSVLGLTKRRANQWVISGPQIQSYTCDTNPREAQPIPLDPDKCAPNVSIVRRSLKNCSLLNPFYTNGSNCIVTATDDLSSDDRSPPLVRLRCFAHYNMSDIVKDDKYRNVFDTALLSYRAYLSTKKIQHPTPSSDVFINQYKRGKSYPYRTIVPPFSRVYVIPLDFEARNLSCLPIADSDPVASFTKNFNTHENVLNQPFISSFAVDMNRVDWTSMDSKNNGLTDFQMDGVKPVGINAAMRIIAIRTVLSELFGMDIAALICDEPVPSYRAVENGKHFTQRKLPFNANTPKGMKLTMSPWCGEDGFLEGYTCSVDNTLNNVVLSKNGTKINDDKMQDIIVVRMLSIIQTRLKAFIDIVNASDKQNDKTRANDIENLREFTTSHLLRLFLYSKRTDKTISGTFGGSDPKNDHFPYELEFHGVVVRGGDETVESNDPRSWYAHTPAQYVSELEDDKMEGIFSDIEGTHWTNENDPYSLLHKDYTDSALAFENTIICDTSFVSECTKYIERLVNHATVILNKEPHYPVVIDALCGSDTTEQPKYGASTHASMPPLGNITPVQDGAPVPVSILKNGGNETEYHFPIGTSTNDANSNGELQAIAGRTQLNAQFVRSGSEHVIKRFNLIPIGNHESYSVDEVDTQGDNGDMTYNVDITRPQMFAMIDAAGLLWHARSYTNPSDCNRPTITEAGQCDGMHYWCRTMVETFVSAREIYRERESSSIWEMDVKKYPSSALPSSLIGSLCDDTWRSYFPLLPFDHELRDDLRRCRALSVLWGTLPTYSSGVDSTGNTGAWMPLAPAHHMRLYGTVGLFDGKFRVPKNPWLPNNGTGISLVFNQSYHSVYHCDNYRAAHFQDWLLNANRFQPPNVSNGECTYPFSQYGGTPVEADFIPHIVERCASKSHENRHRQLKYNRFGFTNPLRIGNQFHDTGLLQDMFQFKYRPYADLSNKQRQRPVADRVHISNFLSYARTHAIIALASCNHGTQDESIPHIVRNLYRLYVDTYECMGSNTDDDSVPCVMGFSPAPINKRDDRGVILYAGSLACLNSKLSAFCSSSMNRGERICPIYKQVYLNDATLLYTRLLRQERRKILHDNNFMRARMKRGRGYGRHDFDRDLVDLQDAYIEFLQNTVLGMLIEAGADLSGAPLHLLEPRELEVSLFQEDDNLVGNDFLTPRTREIIAQSDFGGDNLTRSQLAILSLIPPNHRILGTLRLNQSMEVVDLEHAKKQIQKETMESNKKVWQRYSEGLISAAFAQKLLEVDGPIDFSLDMSSIQDPMHMRFDMNAFKDPLKESERIQDRMTTTHAQSSSSLSLNQRGEKMRKSVASDSVLNMTTKELNRALALVRERVEREYTAHNGARKRIQILEMLRIPAHVRRILRPEYEGGFA